MLKSETTYVVSFQKKDEEPTKEPVELERLVEWFDLHLHKELYVEQSSLDKIEGVLTIGNYEKWKVQMTRIQ